MAGDPGSVFARDAVAPLERACAQFEQDRWALGIEAASAEALRAALGQAVRSAATACSASPDAVRGLLPGDKLDHALKDLAPLHAAALTTARTYASSFSGLLARSIHVEDASPCSYLRALASHHSADDFISGPLSKFADALSGWQELMDRCSRDVGDSRALAASFRRRRLVLAGVGAIAVVLISILLASLGWWWLVAEASRKRLQVTLDNADPCTFESVKASDRKHASAGQLALLAQREQACVALRQRQNYVARCSSLADHVETNQLTPDDEAAAGPAAGILKRVASSSLTLEDLLADPPELPCADTPSQARLRASFGKRAAGSASLWAQAERVSPKMSQLLTTPELALTPESQAQLAAHADAVSRKAIVVGVPAEMAHARALCDLQRTMNAGPPGRGCKALDRIGKK
jgi:hypothetical protein